MTDAREIVVLSGGLGGARLAMAAVENGWSDRVAFITNVADDWEVGGLLVCPDTDAVIYGLTGRFDDDRGWGVSGDVFPGPRDGEPAWFNLGAKDRLHHEWRTGLVHGGATLSETTTTQTAACDALVVPVTNDRVRSMVKVGGTWQAFQSWLIRHHAAVPDEVKWDGIEDSAPAPGVVELIAGAATVVIGSSSPIASIGPIVAVPGVSEALRRRRGPVIALSPISSRRITTTRDERRRMARQRLMHAQGLDHEPLAVLDWLGPIVTHFALDVPDAHLAPEVEARCVAPMVFPILGLDPGQRAAIGRELLGTDIRHG